MWTCSRFASSMNGARISKYEPMGIFIYMCIKHFIGIHTRVPMRFCISIANFFHVASACMHVGKQVGRVVGTQASRKDGSQVQVGR